MKKAKWIISVFIMLLCFILSSELFQNYMGAFSNQFFYFDVSVVDNRMNLHNLFLEYAEDSDIGIFSIDKVTYNARSTGITIYATDAAQDVLQNEYYILNGKKQSLFSGVTDVVYKDFSGIVSDESITRYYFTGTKEQVIEIRDKIYNSYATSYIHKETATGMEWVIGAIWIIACLFILLLTWLDIQFQKKEIFIRLSLGSSPWNIIGENVLKDMIFFIAAFITSYCILHRFIYLDYGLNMVFITVFVFIVINSTVYLTLMKYDYKQILYGANINERTLSNSYVLKAVALIITIASISVNVSLVLENGRYLGYYQDIHKLDEYGLLHTEPAMDVWSDDYNNEYSIIKTEIFLDFYKEDKVAFSISYASDKTGIPIITLTDTAKELVSNSGILNNLSECDYHVFVPQDKAESFHDDDIEFALLTSSSLFGQDVNNVTHEVIYYDNAEVLYFDFLETSKLSVGFDKVKNPVFVYCTLLDDSFEQITQNTDDLMHENMFSNFLFKLTEKEIGQISEIDGIKSVSYTNLVEQCNQYKNSLLRVVLLNSIISLFLLLFEMVIILTIIKVEYMVNAKELSIKKILGYSVLSKNRTIFILNLFGAVISIVIMIIVSLMFGVTKVSVVLLVGMVLTVAEVGLIVFNIIKLEKTNIPKILKGGSL